MSHLKVLATFGNYMLVSRVAYILNTYFVRYIIAVFVGPAAVTLIVVPMKLLSFVQGGIGSVAAVVLPFVSDRAARGKEPEFRQMYLRASSILTCLTLPLFLFFIVYAREILAIWMGAGFADDAWIIQVVVGLTFLLSAFTILPTNAILGLGQSRVVASFAVGTAVLNIGLCSVLTAAYGALGAALAVLGTQVLAFPFVWYVTVRALSIPWGNFIRESIRPGAALSVSFLVLAILSLVLFGVLEWSGGVLPLVAGVVLLVAYFGLALKQGLIPVSLVRQSVGLS